MTIHHLPEGVTPADEIAITWERNDDGVKIVAGLGEASIVVEASYDATHTLPWLVASLPNILSAAYDEIEAAIDEETTEDETPQEGS